MITLYSSIALMLLSPDLVLSHIVSFSVHPDYCFMFIFLGLTTAKNGQRKSLLLVGTFCIGCFLFAEIQNVRETEVIVHFQSWLVNNNPSKNNNGAHMKNNYLFEFCAQFFHVSWPFVYIFCSDLSHLLNN